MQLSEIFNGRRVEIEESLAQIKEYLEKEIIGLKKTIELKDQEIKSSKAALESARQSAEGSRQLVNKLLGDMSKLQNDIEWYKRTYEQRSFLGTVWEKMFRMKVKSKKH